MKGSTCFSISLYNDAINLRWVDETIITARKVFNYGDRVGGREIEFVSPHPHVWGNDCCLSPTYGRTHPPFSKLKIRGQ